MTVQIFCIKKCAESRKAERFFTEQVLIDDPLLLRAPLVRCDGRATGGYAPEIWQTWLDAPLAK